MQRGRRKGKGSRVWNKQIKRGPERETWQKQESETDVRCQRFLISEFRKAQGRLASTLVCLTLGSRYCLLGRSGHIMTAYMHTGKGCTNSTAELQPFIWPYPWPIHHTALLLYSPWTFDWFTFMPERERIKQAHWQGLPHIKAGTGGGGAIIKMSVFPG